MPGHDIIVVGASAGGVEALSQLVRNLPPDLPATLFFVLHIPAQGTSFLPKILNRAIQKRQGESSSLHAVHPEDKEAIQHGRIYVAPPDRHLLIKNGHIHLARGPRENNHRPAVDPLFRTAAGVYGRRVVGVVLSGTLDDGTAGLVAVKRRGGVAIVQNPDEALYSGMPRSAIENVNVDHILPISQIAPVLVELAYKPVEEEAVSSDMEIESDMAQLDLEAMQKSDRPGTPSPFSCPDCGGTLWELNEVALLRFRCRTGHAFSVNSLLAKQSDAVEEALWSALRALEEKAALSDRMAHRAHERNQSISAKRFETHKQDVQQHAATLRQLLLKGAGNDELSKNNGHTVQENRAGEAQEASFHVVMLGASTGGLNALSEVLSALPGDFPAVITVIQHLQPSELADILQSRTVLQVKQAESGDVLYPGKVYIAPANNHLLVNPDSTLSLSHSEFVQFMRPSADLLFESVAGSFKQRAIAVVLTGKGSDGAIGVQAIKKMGGIAIAQAQSSCEDFGMPQAAINTGSVDLVLPLNEIAATLVRLVTDKK